MRRHNTQGGLNATVEWASSIIAVFWSIWWATYVDGIIHSSRQRFVYAGLDWPKFVILLILAVWSAIFAVILTRWLDRMQGWSPETGVGVVITRSRSIWFAMVALTGIIYITYDGFGLLFDTFLYGLALSWAWFLAPLVIAIYPQDRR